MPEAPIVPPPEVKPVVTPPAEGEVKAPKAEVEEVRRERPGILKTELAATARRERFEIKKESAEKITQGIEAYVRHWRQAQVSGALTEQELAGKLRYVEKLAESFRQRVDKGEEVFQTPEEVVGALITFEDMLFRYGYALAIEFKASPETLNQALERADRLAREVKVGKFRRGGEAIVQWLSEAGAKLSTVPDIVKRKEVAPIGFEAIDESVWDPYVEESGFLTRGDKVEHFLELEGLRAEIIGEILDMDYQDPEFPRLLELSWEAFDDTRNPLGIAKNELRHHNLTVGQVRRLFEQQFPDKDSLADLTPKERRSLFLDASDAAATEALNELSDELLEKKLLSASTRETLTKKASEIREKAKPTEEEKAAKGEGVSAAESQITELESEIGQVNQELDRLNKEIKDNERELRKKRKENERLNYADEKVQRLEDKIEPLEGRKGNLERQLDGLRSRRAGLTREIDQTRQAIETTPREERAELRSRLVSLQSELSITGENEKSLAGEIESLDRKSTALKSQIVRIREALAACDTLEVQLTAQREEISILEEKLKGKRDEEGKLIERGLERELTSAKRKKARLEQGLQRLERGEAPPEKEEEAKAYEVLGGMLKEENFNRIMERVRTGEVPLSDLSHPEVALLTLKELIFTTEGYTNYREVIDKMFSEKNILVALVYYYRPEAITLETVRGLTDLSEISVKLAECLGQIKAHSRPEAADFVATLMEQRVLAALRDKPFEVQPLIARVEPVFTKEVT